ncbi:SMI1/KNR4 family protein [Chitinophaga sp. W3I9]|uniref:SMI1/KNR4 family protein n=1 Tax=Chitinophaga sp. W3I9 TaxID=3373924 RepID=UPI003D1D8F77
MPVLFPKLVPAVNPNEFTPPADYLDFIKKYNGPERAIGNNQNLKLWGIEELVKLNTYYEVDRYAPDYFIFGSDVGGTAYAFNKQNSSIV